MKRQVARVILPDGSETVVRPRDSKKFSLLELQSFVGGNIELIHLPPGNGHNTAYVNEEGKLEGLQLNPKATEMYGRHAVAGQWDVIVGPLVIVTVEKRDNCEICHGEKGGEPGNENVIDGKRVCDYCHAEMLKKGENDEKSV